jgi:hypothetical protein
MNSPAGFARAETSRKLADLSQFRQCEELLHAFQAERVATPIPEDERHSAKNPEGVAFRLGQTCTNNAFNLVYES